MDRLIVRYISPRSANTESGSNEPGEKKPKYGVLAACC
jgi:hypothetical protein